MRNTMLYFTMTHLRKISAVLFLFLLLSFTTAWAMVSFGRNQLANSFRHGQGVTLADIDGDNDQDIILSLSLNDAVYLYRNDGGSWSNAIPIAADNTIVAMQTAVADFDNDGRLDVAAAGLFDRSCTFCAAGELTWYKQPATLTDAWTEQIISDTLWGAIDVDAGDLNGDGRPDLVVSTVDIGGTGAGIYWTRNAGSGTFAALQPLDAALPNVRSAAIIDVDQDNALDVIAISQSGNQLVWFENNRSSPITNPTFTAHVISTPPDPTDFTLANLDDDATPEIIVVSDLGVTRYDATSDPTQPWVQQTIDASYGTADERLVSADIDADGDSDIAIASVNAAALGWYRNDGASWTYVPIDGQSGISGIAAGLVNADSAVDLVTTTYEQSSTTDELVLWSQTVPTNVSLATTQTSDAQPDALILSSAILLLILLWRSVIKVNAQ